MRGAKSSENSARGIFPPLMETASSTASLKRWAHRRPCLQARSVATGR
jgi:hypothetical protein